MNSPSYQSSSTKIANDVSDRARQIGDKAQDAYQSARDTALRTTNKVTRQIRDKPVQSSILALGIGYILGKLFSR